MGYISPQGSNSENSFYTMKRGINKRKIKGKKLSLQYAVLLRGAVISDETSTLSDFFLGFFITQVPPLTFFATVIILARFPFYRNYRVFIVPFFRFTCGWQG